MAAVYNGEGIMARRINRTTKMLGKENNGRANKGGRRWQTATANNASVTPLLVIVSGGEKLHSHYIFIHPLYQSSNVLYILISKRTLRGSAW